MFIWGEKEGKNEKELKEPALMQQFPTTEFRTELDLFTHEKKHWNSAKLQQIHLKGCSNIWLHKLASLLHWSAAVSCTGKSQQEGPGFKSWHGVFLQ